MVIGDVRNSSSSMLGMAAPGGKDRLLMFDDVEAVEGFNRVEKYTFALSLRVSGVSL